MIKRIFISLLVALWLGPALAADEPKADDKKPEVDPKVVQEIFNCIAVGLPGNWRRAWVVVTELGKEGGARHFEADFYYAAAGDEAAGHPLQPCDKEKVAKDVYSLNQFLPTYEKRQWRQATLLFTSDGSFNLKYDYEK